MELTPLQLEIQKLGAYKELSFGCIVYGYKRLGQLASDADFIESCEEGLFIHADGRLSGIAKGPCTDFKVIGHPITYSRLCYLLQENYSDKLEEKFDSGIEEYFRNYSGYYNQSILERPEELQLLVRDFLLSIQ